MKEEEGPPHFAYKRLRVSTPLRLVTIRLFVLTIITIFQFLWLLDLCISVSKRRQITLQLMN